MHNKPVIIPESDLQLSGFLYQPETSDPVPGLILLHEWHPYDTNGAETVTDIATALAEAGYVTLALSMRGWPDTGGEDDCGEKQPHDVLTAITWLSKQSGVNSEQLGVIGFSRGGSIALLSAALSKQLKAVVAFYPVTDIDRWAETTEHAIIRDWYIPEICAKGAGSKAKSPIHLAHRIEAATLLIHGDQDRSVPPEQSERLAAAMRQRDQKVTLHIIKSGKHEGLSLNSWKSIEHPIKRFLDQVFETPDQQG